MKSITRFSGLVKFVRLACYLKKIATLHVSTNCATDIADLEVNKRGLASPPVLTGHERMTI